MCILLPVGCCCWSLQMTATFYWTGQRRVAQSVGNIPRNVKPILKVCSCQVSRKVDHLPKKPHTLEALWVNRAFTIMNKSFISLKLPCFNDCNQTHAQTTPFSTSCTTQQRSSFDQSTLKEGACVDWPFWTNDPTWKIID